MKGLFGTSGRAGNNGNGRGGPAPTQDHVPIEMVRDDVIVCKASQQGGRNVSAVIRVGSADVTRMSQADRADFLERYAACVARWKFPYQILVWRERQRLTEFLERVTDRRSLLRSAGQGEWSEHLDELTGWMQRVTATVNPQVPAYYIALPHSVSSLLGSSMETALAELDSRTRLVIGSLAPLGIGCVRVKDKELIQMLVSFYHPTLPMLRLTPRARLQSLMVATDLGEA